MRIAGKKNPRAARRMRGISLIESATACMIMALACTALIKLSLTTTIHNGEAHRLSAAIMLAENVREMMAGLPFNDPNYGLTSFGPETGETLAKYNDVDDFNGFDSSVRADLAAGEPVGVIGANRAVITEVLSDGTKRLPPEWVNWRQTIAVKPIKTTDLYTLETDNTKRALVRIEVTISHKDGGAWAPVTKLCWLKAR